MDLTGIVDLAHTPGDRALCPAPAPSAGLTAAAVGPGSVGLPPAEPPAALSTTSAQANRADAGPAPDPSASLGPAISCDRMLIHVPGFIQPHGALLSLRPDDFVILQASANLSSIIGPTGEAALGRPVQEVLGEAAGLALQGLALQGLALQGFGHHDGGSAREVLRLEGPRQTRLSLRAHRSGTVICLEIEPLAPAAPGATASINEAQTVIDVIGRTTGRAALCAAVAHEVRRLTGYDRVTVYRFESDDHGEVVAESLIEALPPYLGLNYPAGDIPLPARKMFLRQRLRLIGDRSYQPVMVASHPTLHEDTQLDMTLVTLRGVAPVHIEFMGNMGVQASFSLALTYGGRLWGLVMGHHGSARWMDPELRAALDIVGQTISLLLHSHDTADNEARSATRATTMQAIGGNLASPASVMDSLVAGQSELLQLVGAGGALIRASGAIRAIGRVPPLAVAERAMATLLEAAAGRPLAVNDLGLRYPDLVACIPDGSGALLLPLSPTTDDAVLWFRPETIHTDLWAGNPGKGEPAGEGAQSSPRKSFEPWTEVVRGHAVPWCDYDMVSARELHLVIESMARLRFATKAGGLGVWEIDLRTGAIAASQICCETFVGNAAGFGYRAMRRAIHPDDRARVRRAAERCVEGGANLSEDCRVARPDGTTGWIRLQARTERAKDGTRLKLAGFSLDITERVQTEHRIRHSQQVAAVGRLTAGVAHDFNNLLLALGGSLEILLDAISDRPEAIEWGLIALRAATRGRELTDRLLTVSRKQTLLARPVAIDLLFREIEVLIRNLFHARTGARIELAMLPPAADLAVMADLAQLEAALINLAVNARDAMERGGRLSFSARTADADLTIVEPGQYTVISVADTGSGMDAATLARICEPFFSTKGAEGTGLGLAMVQGFARQSGGEAHITSAPGKGTTVDLWLPSARPVPAEEAPAAAPVRIAGHVLLVDDSQDLLVIVAAFLRGADIKVTARSQAAVALSELEAGARYDLIVTDFAMPGMTGLEFVQRAREIDPSIAAVIITGFSDPDLLAGFQDIAVLRKPFKRAELVETVRRLVAASLLAAA